MKKAIRIEVEYDDGSRDFAEGEAAEAIWSWLMGCEQLNCVHGAFYSGPKFEHTAPVNESI